MNKITQTEAVLDWLTEHGTITRRIAEDELGILQLPTRIFELKEAGVAISKRMIEVRTRYGNGKTKVAEYYLTPCIQRPTDE